MIGRTEARRALGGSVAVTATLLAASCGSSASTVPSNSPPAPTPPGCAPTPCATASGLTVHVIGVAPSFSPSAVAGSTLDPALTWCSSSWRRPRGRPRCCPQPLSICVVRWSPVIRRHHRGRRGVPINRSRHHGGPAATGRSDTGLLRYRGRHVQRIQCRCRPAQRWATVDPVVSVRLGASSDRVQPGLAGSPDRTPQLLREPRLRWGKDSQCARGLLALLREQRERAQGPAPRGPDRRGCSGTRCRCSPSGARLGGGLRMLRFRSSSCGPADRRRGCWR